MRPRRPTVPDAMACGSARWSAGGSRRRRCARLFVCAPSREDYGLAQLEALADGCQLVSAPSPGPYVALAIARRLDPRLVDEDLARALRAALRDPLPGYAAEARRALAPFARAAVDQIVGEQLLPRLLA